MVDGREELHYFMMINGDELKRVKVLVWGGKWWFVSVYGGLGR